MAHPIAPALETLEDRTAPATWGNPWPDAAHLTLSFAPDGTLIGGQASNLFAKLDLVASHQTWQTMILRAFQAWAVNANINVGLTAAGGQALGSSVGVQAVPRSGRVGRAGAPIDRGVVAFASPFAGISGTWAGGVRIHTAQGFSIGAEKGFGLFPAMLPDEGHAFGIENSTSSASVMYEQYM